MATRSTASARRSASRSRSSGRRRSPTLHARCSSCAGGDTVRAYLTLRVGNPREDGRVMETARRRSPLSGLATRTFDAVPPPALVLIGIVSVQLGSAVAKQLFGEVGAF